MELNIVQMIESNPMMKISDTYQCKLLEKMQKSFTEMEQQMFVANFYGYLKYNSKTDFVIDLDSVWKWLGFTTKQNARRLLEKQFVIDNDYKNLLIFEDNQKSEEPPKKGSGGHNIQKIMMTIKTFKSLCLKAGTKKADEIHEYYIKMEELLQETISEECEGLKLQLMEKVSQLEETEAQLEEMEIQLEERDAINQTEKEMLRQMTILEHFPDHIQCVYYGLIDNVNSNGESLLKFGMSNYLRDRVAAHTKTFDNFRLVNAFKVENKVHIENEMKQHPILKSIRRKIILNQTVQTELLVNSLPFEELDDIIKNIISKIEYSPENYTKLLDENVYLQKEIHSLKVIEIPPVITPSKKPYLKIDGAYHVDGKVFEKLVGTREEVWEEKAYKTSGGLLKCHLLFNKLGKVVSKVKFIHCKSKPSPFTEYDKFRTEQALLKKLSNASP